MIKKYIWIDRTAFIPKIGTFKSGDKFPIQDKATMENLLKRKSIKEVKEK